MKRKSGTTGRVSMVLIAAMLLLACGSPPTGSPPSQTTSATASGDAAFQAEWSALIDAARKEGKVVVRAGTLPEFRAELPRAFKERFGVDVDYISGSPSEMGSQVDRERAAGLYN